MSNWQLKTPIGFFIFNRPDVTALVFAEIAKAKPAKLLVVADGPRENTKGESEKCLAARAIIQTVDWDCEVLTNYSDINLGCKLREASGIDWIFNQVEEAIILEDDCLPDPTFFRFCEELLERFRLDQRVAMISGNNFQNGLRINLESYYFSNYSHGWGWATWRDRWQYDYDLGMKYWPCYRDEKRIVDCFHSRAERKYWNFIFERVYQSRIDTYDYQWFFACVVNGRVSILPNINLVSNIGFGNEATHTIDSGKGSKIPTSEMEFPLIHPKGLFVSRRLDLRYFKRFVAIPFYQRLFNKSFRLLRFFK